MTHSAARWLRRALLAGLGVALAVACATPDYKFVPNPKPDHCRNNFADLDLGETDTDCGGEECQDCPLGSGCLATSDCEEGICLDGFCQVPGCDDGAQSGDETAVDCGGSCKPCQTGEGCVVAGDCDSQVCTDGVCTAPSCTDGIINGSETGRDCGGGICEGCGTGTPCNDAIDCKSGVCSTEAPRKCEISCQEGTAECDADPAVECETNILTDAEHCGDCDTTCALAHAEQSCVSGRCQIGGCTAPYDDCNNRASDGCETNTKTSASDCGGCGNVCSDDHGTPSCANSECAIDCDAGFSDCDDDRSNGCERSVATDVEACGTCTHVCPFGNGETPFCVDGACGATVCPDGKGNCDGIGEDCEKDLTIDVNNCGRCGGVCTVRNGTPRCGADGCAVDTCDDGWDNCDTTAPDAGYANGCETHTDVDVMNCGACGNDCTVLHGSATCVAGECRVMACDAGWFNCDSTNSDGGYANGCETNTAGDKTNCGVCGRNCDTLLASANATGKCVTGLCQRDACLPNFGDCDTNVMTCESDFRSDEGDCGVCGRACVPTGTTTQGNECLSGTCTPHCDANHANCDTQGPNGCEVDIRTDNANCGGCNQPCGTGRTCAGGSCMCTGGLMSCSGSCVNTANDNANCGGCGTVCTGGRSCVTSVCQCPAGQTFCGGTCVNMQTDPANCGVCGRTCDTPAGTPTNTCSGGACHPVCASLRDSCDNEPWDGCEENLASNNANCGMCGRACQFSAAAHVNPATQAGNTCNASGACVPTCAAGWDNCDGEPWDGCETDITSITNCGMCGKDCADAACGSTGSTSCCIASGSAYDCQSQMTYTGTHVEGSVIGSRLDSATGTTPPYGPIPSHNLQAGTNRLVLLVVASETGGGGVTAARPDVVTYGGVNMLAGPEQSGGARFWSPDLFTYYLTDATGLSGTGPKAIVVDGTPATPNPGSPAILIAHLVQLNGVRQTNPIQAFAGGVLADHADPDAIAQSVNFSVAGSRIYSVVAGLWSNNLTYSLAPTGATLTQTFISADLNGGGTVMRAAGVYVGGGSASSLPIVAAPGYTVTWNTGNSDALTHLAIVIHPAQQ